MTAGRVVVLVLIVAGIAWGTALNRRRLARMSLVVAVHADTEDVDPAGPDLPDLGWYAVQEIPELLV